MFSSAYRSRLRDAHAGPGFGGPPPTILALGAVALSVLMLACGSGASTSSPGAPTGSPSLAGSTAAAASTGPAGSGATSPSIRLYTSVTQDTVDAVLAGFAKQHPEIAVDVFRAPTGQLDARIASEQRSGGIKGDVLWETDPPSMHQYESQGLLLAWTPAEAASIPAIYTTTATWGTRLLNMVLVAANSASPQPTSWLDLNSGAYDGKLAIPDPGFAGSAFAALGYFGTTTGYGLDYYRSLKQHGAVQVSAIGDVITGVANGQYLVGMSLDKSIRDEVTKGSPIKLVWPKEGAIAIYSPIAVFGSSTNAPASEALVNYILSADGQTRIAGTGWQPVRADVPWEESGGGALEPDWTTIFGQQDQLLKDYRSIFGG